MSQEHAVQVIRIGEIQKHPNADSLSLTHIHGGYPVIFQTGIYKEGDLAVYLPVDSVVPADDERWDFLRTGDGKPVRIRAKKLRGIFSMGLLTPAEPDWTEDQDVTELLRIKVWEPAMDVSTRGDNEHDPGYMPIYTDIEGLRKYRNVLEPDEEVICTEKIHGANGRWTYAANRLWVGSRTGIKKHDPRSIWWIAAEEARLEDKLAPHEGHAVYGEVYGQVQDLRYGVDRGCKLVLFDALDCTTKQYLDYDDFLDLARKLDLPTVPTLYRGPFKDIPADLANGKTVLANGACVREGYVVRPTKERWHPKVGRVILKMVGEDYHLRKQKT